MTAQLAIRAFFKLISPRGPVLYRGSKVSGEEMPMRMLGHSSASPGK
jgi:hypothetical protein